MERRWGKRRRNIVATLPGALLLLVSASAVADDVVCVAMVGREGKSSVSGVCVGGGVGGDEVLINAEMKETVIVCLDGNK